MMATLNESQMRAKFEPGYSFPPLTLRLAKRNRKQATPGRQGDTDLAVSFEGRTYQFEAEFKSRNSPKIFQETVLRIAQRGPSGKRLPILIVPYLRDSQLDELQRRKLSGVDLCGNGVIMVPDKLYVYRTGQPNRFPDSGPSKYAYRGVTSLVARAFLCRTEYSSLADIEQEITARGGSVALSTVSKALKRLEEDVIIERKADRIRLLQAIKLLNKLQDFYTPTQESKTVTLSVQQGSQKTKPSWTTLLKKAPTSTQLTLSGQSSVDAYAVMGRQSWPVLYTRDIDSVVEAWNGVAEESSRFIDLELRQTDDPTVYFDARTIENLPYASPVQTYLEYASGDKREQETAQEVRKAILRELDHAEDTR